MGGYQRVKASGCDKRHAVGATSRFAGELSDTGSAPSAMRRRRHSGGQDKRRDEYSTEKTAEIDKSPSLAGGSLAKAHKPHVKVAVSAT